MSRFRFSLRTLLAVMIASGVGMGILGSGPFMVSLVIVVLVVALLVGMVAPFVLLEHFLFGQPSTTSQEARSESDS